MKFSTAILYDVENLIGGYSHPEFLSKLSLKEIHKEILQRELEGVAIQRAYANWSDPRLSKLRDDIAELGIEPVQMFGFGRGSQKNASDIHLAIDAVDVVHTKPHIENFVIVSGDGGFSSLAKKLHEYGKMVVGCAYRTAANNVFKAVCDDFIWIPEPSTNGIATTQAHTVLTTPQNKTPNLQELQKELARKIPRLEQPTREMVIQAAHKVVSVISQSPAVAYALQHQGLDVGVFSLMMKQIIPDFRCSHFGFPRLVELIRLAVHEHPSLKVILKAPSEYKLLQRDYTLKGFEDVPSLSEEGDVHSELNYRELLAKGTPRFLLGDQLAIRPVCEYLVQNREQRLVYDALSDLIARETKINLIDVRCAVTTLVSAECFESYPLEVPFREQTLQFTVPTVEEAVERTRSRVWNALTQMVGTVNVEEFEKLNLN